MNDISVVIPARNARGTISEAIESALGQSLPPEEVLVIDDGSTDGTAEEARRHGHPVRVLTLPPRGPGPARNEGIRLARCPLIAFLDADDIWLPTALATLRAAYEDAPDVGLVYGEVLLETPSTWFAEKRLAASGWVFDRLLVECFILTSAVLASRDILVHVGLFDEDPVLQRGGQDWDLWLRVARHHPLVQVHAPVVRRRVLKTSLSANEFNLVSSRIYVLQKQLCLEAEERLAPRGLIHAELGRWLFRLGRLHYHRGEFAQAQEALQAAGELGGRSRRHRALAFAASLPPPLAGALLALVRTRGRYRIR